LSSKNYRLFISGQTVSLCGSWMTTTANAWLIYHLTGKEVLLGLSAFMAQAATTVLAPFAGVWVDRLDARRTLLVTQSLSMLQSLALTGLCVSGVLPPQATVGAILGLQLIQGAINAIDLPTRQSFGIQMVDRREHLPNAIALNSGVVNVTRFIGPAAAGVVIAAGTRLSDDPVRAGELGAAMCYAFDVLSYMAVIAALFFMRPKAVERAGRGGKFAAQFREGLAYVAGTPAMRTALLLLCVTSFFGVSVNTQLASVAKSALGVGPDGYGMLVAGTGLGATLGAVFLATRRSTMGLPTVISLATALHAAALAGLALAPTYRFALALSPAIGLAMILQAAGTNTFIQSLASDDKRGRVMSFFTLSFMGTVPIGALALGAVAELTTVRGALLVFAGCVGLNALVLGTLLRREGRKLRAAAG
jgi:MFS family permease